MAFYLDRFDGETWTTIRVSPVQIGPNDLDGPSEGYPPAASPGNTSAFSGQRGWLARIRWEDQTFEQFMWDLIPQNPLDPDSFMSWGWRSIMRDYKPIPSDYAVGPLSFVG